MPISECGCLPSALRETGETKCSEHCRQSPGVTETRRVHFPPRGKGSQTDCSPGQTEPDVWPCGVALALPGAGPAWGTGGRHQPSSWLIWSQTDSFINAYARRKDVGHSPWKDLSLLHVGPHNPRLSWRAV